MKTNKSQIMELAHKMTREMVAKYGVSYRAQFGICLKFAYVSIATSKKEIKNVVIKSFCSYNQRRYSAPWVALVNEQGKYDFSKNIGTYTGDGYKGEAGDLVVFEPIAGQIYGYGQKDYRGNNTEKMFAKFDGSQFVRCNKIGVEL